MADIDNLNIQISANAASAEKSLDRLVNKLSELSKSLSGLGSSNGFETLATNIRSLANVDTSKLQSIADNIRTISTVKDVSFTALSSSIKSLANVDTTRINQITTALQNVSSINTGIISNVATSVTTFAGSLAALTGVTFNAESLNGVITALNRFGGRNATTGVQNLSQIGDRLRIFVEGLNGIGSLTFDATSLTELINQIGRLGLQNAQRAADVLPRVSISLRMMIEELNRIGSLRFDPTRITSLVSAVAQLGNITSGRGLDRIPNLTANISVLINTLARAPVVNNNTVRLTEALARLAAQGSRVGTAANAMNRALNNTNTTMRNARVNAGGLAAAFGRFYARFWLIIRAVRRLWRSIESSMNYIEVLNYFDAAWGQVASQANIKQWQELGYRSAEEYADSFSERAKELTEKMTGFNVDKSGMLTATGVASLGINPSQVMNYQAMFGQMSSSMGIASEQALKLSNALTMIGADLASVKNLDFDKVWQDMASGLAGMSRTLDKYGVNIRNVNLQQKLNELGIEANISALNQNDKALLRTIILLDSTRYAWGDLSETISKPANQFRLLQSNIQMLGQTIGNLFLPLIQRLLPWINGLVIALQRLFTWLANLLGIDLTSIVQSQGSNGISDLLDDTEDLTDALEDTNEAVADLKKGIRSFDELVVIDTESGKKDNTKGLDDLRSQLLNLALDDILSEYQAAWDKAFSEMENRAQQFADKLEKYFEPVKKLFKDLFAGDFLAAGKDFSDIIIGIFNAISSAFEKVDWYKVGHNIGEFLAGIDWLGIMLSVARAIWKGLSSALELLHGMFDAAPIQTAILTAMALLNWTPLGGIIGGALSRSIASAIARMLGIAIEGEGVFALLRTLGRQMGHILWTNILAIFGNTSAIGEMATLTAQNAGLVRFTALFSGIVGVIGGAYIAFKNFFDMLNEGFSWGHEVLMVFGVALAALFAIVAGVPATVAAVTAAVVAIVMSAIVVIHDNWDAIRDFLVSVGDHIGEFFYGVFTEIGENARHVWERIRESAGSLRDAVVGTAHEIANSFRETWSNIATGARNAAERVSQGFHNIVNGIGNAINSMISWVERGINTLINGLNNFLSSISGIFGMGDVNIPQVSFGRVPHFANGGYPSRASLFWAGENGIPEMLGTVGGKTAVAGGAEITGIVDAVYSTGRTEQQLLERTISLLETIAGKDYGISDKDIFRSVQRSSYTYIQRTGKYPFQ